MYIKWKNATIPVPQLQLSGLERRTIPARSTAAFNFTLTPDLLAVWLNDDLGFVVEPGR